MWVLHVLIIIMFIICNWVVTRWQWLFYMYTNMKKVTRKLKSGGLHERHVVATWKLGNRLSIRLWTQGNQEKPVSRWPVAGPSGYWLLVSSPALVHWFLIFIFLSFLFASFTLFTSLCPAVPEHNSPAFCLNYWTYFVSTGIRRKSVWGEVRRENVETSASFVIIRYASSAQDKM